MIKLKVHIVVWFVKMMHLKDQKMLLETISCKMKEYCKPLEIEEFS